MKKQLALDLIQKCKEEKSEFLDLGNCSLRTVPNEVFDLIHLRCLNLGRRFFKDGEWEYTKNEGDRNKLHQIPEELIRLEKPGGIIIGRKSDKGY